MTAGTLRAQLEAAVRLSAPKANYIEDPRAWFRDRLCEEIWSKQAEIMESLRDNKFTAVPSAHGTGKSFLGGRSIVYFVDTHTPGETFVISTAPAAAQVSSILWREVGKAHRKAREIAEKAGTGHGFGGKINTAGYPQWKLHDGPDGLIGYGRKPADYSESSFQGIHCLSTEHQILTRRGWLGIDEMTEADEVLSPPIDGQEATWQPVTAVHRYDYDGPMRDYQGPSVSFSATGHHRMAAHRGTGRWELKEYDELPREWWVRRGSTWAGEDFTVPAPFAAYGWDAEQFARFLGFWIGDGGLRHHAATGRFYEVLLYQTKRADFVDGLLVGVRHSRKRDYWSVSNRAAAEWLLSNVGRYQTDRRIPSFVKDAPPPVLHALCDGLWEADGTHRRDGARKGLYTTSAGLADDVQEVLIKLGRTPSVGVNRAARTGPSPATPVLAADTQTRICYHVGWRRPIPERGSRLHKRNVRTVQYAGRIWCISTPHGTFYTRRDGKVMLTGNSPEGVLIVVDEAAGISRSLMQQVDSIATNEGCRVLLIGNPTDPASYFAEACKPGSKYHVIRIDGLRLPTFTRKAIEGRLPLTQALMEAEGVPYSTEQVGPTLRKALTPPSWVEECLQDWCSLDPVALAQLEPEERREQVRSAATGSPVFTARVRALFPDTDTNAVIPLHWVEAAMVRWEDWKAGDPAAGIEPEAEPPGRRVVGVDVAREGDDKTALAIRQGHVVQKVVTYSKEDTMRTVARVRPYLDHPQALAVVDTIGLGAGVYDRLRELHTKKEIHGTSVGFVASAQSHRTDRTGKYRFRNDRGAAWWNLRELLDPAFGSRICLPRSDSLMVQLTTPKWWLLDGSPTIIVETSEELKKRLKRSPDEASAVVQAFWFTGAPPVSADVPAGQPLAYGGDGMPVDGVIAYPAPEPETWGAENWVDDDGVIGYPGASAW